MIKNEWKTRFQELLEDGNINVLLGAGSSAGYFSLLGDIENLITEIEGGSTSIREKTISKAILFASFFRGVLEKNIDLLEDHAEEELTQRYVRFLRQINRLLIERNNTLLNKEANIFTTNVDLAIELAADLMGSRLNDGFTGRFTPIFSASNFGSLHYRRSSREGKISEEPTVNLVKLHGSVSWRSETQTDDRGARIELDRNLDDINQISEAYDELIEDLPDCPPGIRASQVIAEAKKVDDPTAKLAKSFVRDYSQLSIVNPTKAKFGITVMEEIYYELLRQFANELERENSLLLVVGFSFRDEHIRSLVLRAARSNPTLQVLAFAYSHADGVSLRNLMPQSSTPNSNVHVITTEDVQQNEEEEEHSHIDLDWVTNHVLVSPTNRPSQL